MAGFLRNSLEQEDLRDLDDAFAAHEELAALREDKTALPGNVVFQGSLEVGMAHAREVGVKTLGMLVTGPSFREAALQAGLKAANDSPEIAAFKRQAVERGWLPEATDTEETAPDDAEAAEAARVLLERLRSMASIGHIAIGWAFGEAYQVRTYGALVEFFDKDATGDTEPPAAAEQQDNRPAVALEFGPECVVITEGAASAEVPYYKATTEPVPITHQAGQPFTLADVRREATKRAVEWFGNNPDAKMSPEAFYGMIQEIVGADYEGKRYLLYRAVKEWWANAFLLQGGGYIIEQYEQGRKPFFRLNPYISVEVPSPAEGSD